MKKLGTLLCLSTALLGADLAQANWTGNWLLGASAGWAQDNGLIEISGATVDSTTTTTVDRLRSDNFAGGVFGGYQIRCNRWIMGAELNLTWEDNNDDSVFASETSSVATVSYDRDVTAGLTGRLGFEFWPWLAPYVRAGVETSRDTLEVAFAPIDATTALPIVPAAAGFGSNSERSWRGILGIGVETPVPVFMGLTGRVEYGYHFKGKHITASSEILEIADPAPTGIFGIATTRPAQHSVMASLVWNFMP